MMRFFMPSHPAGRLEYLLVMIGTYVVGWFAVVMVLGLSVDTQTRELTYDASTVTAVLCIIILVVAVQWITVLRRLYDLHMGSGWVVCTIIPLVSIFFHLYLLLASGVSRETFAPYGSNPYNPDSWVAPAPTDGSAGPAVTFQGQALLLPGEEEVDDAA